MIDTVDEKKNIDLKTNPNEKMNLDAKVINQVRKSPSPLERDGVRFGGLPREAQWHRAIRYKLPCCQRAEFIPSGVSGGFPLLSLAEAPNKFTFASYLLLFLFLSTNIHAQKITDRIIVGAEQLDLLLPKLKNQRVVLMVNHTATIGKTHLVDSLQKRSVDIKKIFAVEHGFRGNADAGEKIIDGLDTKTGLPVVSLYGSAKKDKKPSAQQLADVDVVIFDIQDVGVRFFTYISSLHYLMEACAEQNKKLIVLDRPNPNGSYVDGPVLLDSTLKSFVGMHPIPIVHGLTVGELAQMINGEGWLEGKKKCSLEVIVMKNYTHQTFYSLPIKPSPNLPNYQAIALYPSTCLFEGTALSVGRGTQHPFEYIGHPDLKKQPFQFTPISIDGMAKKPPHENKLCYGLDLSKEKTGKEISLKYLIQLYQQFPDKEKFFISYFDKLAGTKLLKEQIKKGMTEKQIKDTWKPELEKYKKMRKGYLIYN